MGIRARENHRKTKWGDLPHEFDPGLYRSRYLDVQGRDDQKLPGHFRATGVAEGRNASAISDRTSFVRLAKAADSVLEIGPLANPALRGDGVKYFDVLPTEGLRRRAQERGLDSDDCPSIDYVSPTGDLSVIAETFDAVLSCHAIEHQPDLIRHLLQVAHVLDPGGSYFLANPDVADASLNAKGHYLTCGREEGRKLCRERLLPGVRS